MISVVVPTRNNSPDLRECLESLSSQTRPVEIIVVFDSNKDFNIPVAKKHGAKIVFDANGTIGSAYSVGARMASGYYVAFTDDDCIVPDNWIERAEKELKDVDVLGGEDILPKNTTRFQRAAYQIDLARKRDNSLHGKDAEQRLRAANIFYKRSLFDKENFNPRLKGLQEPEFNRRLLKKGCKMKFDPKLFVHHKRRSSLKGIFFQIYRNGKAKIDLLRLHKDMISVVDIFPFIYIAITAVLAYMAFSGEAIFIKLWIAATLAYFLLKPMAILAKTRQISLYPYLFFIVVVREIAYSLGILVGTLKAVAR